MQHGLTAYKALQGEIELLTIRMEDVEHEYVATYRGNFTGGRVPWMPVDKAIERLDELRLAHAELFELLSAKRTALARMDDCLATLDGPSQRVAILRDVEGLPLEQIAVQLGRSLSSVKKISAKLPRCAG